MSEREEVDRYEKLLNDWRPGAPAGKRRSSVGLTTAHNESITPIHEEPVDYRVPAVHAPGAILSLGEHTLVIYKQSVPDKGYDLVYTLLPGGTMKLQGVALSGHAAQEIGSIGQPYFDQLQTTMHWNRDLIVFHCYRYEDVAKIPAAPSAAPDATPQPSKPEPQPVRTAAPQPAYQPTIATQPVPPPPPEDPRKNLKRGQRIQVRFGQKAWDAVYWGQDDQGQVVAHQTYNNWSLMHLDLDRFSGSNMMVDPNIDEQLVRTIEQGLNGSK